MNLLSKKYELNFTVFSLEKHSPIVECSAVLYFFSYIPRVFVSKRPRIIDVPIVTRVVVLKNKYMYITTDQSHQTKIKPSTIQKTRKTSFTGLFPSDLVKTRCMRFLNQSQGSVEKPKRTYNKQCYSLL